MVQVFRSNGFIDDSSVRYGFFGRQGGASEGVYHSLNCGLGSDDDPALVRDNRGRVAGELGLATEADLFGVYQVHGDVCARVDTDFEGRPEADALVTDRAGAGVSVVTADCAPVLFYARKADGAPVVAAAHAGWRGALGGVLEATVEAMCGYDGVEADAIAACVGPAIARGSYEVSLDFAKPFLIAAERYEVFFSPGAAENKLQFDLPGFCALRLAEAGLKQVSVMDMDTYAREDDFFSYRRGTHRSTTEYGRQISAIAIV